MEYVSLLHRVKVRVKRNSYPHTFVLPRKGEGDKLGAHRGAPLMEGNSNFFIDNDKKV